jgi:hypothetical protein
LVSFHVVFLYEHLVSLPVGLMLENLLSLQAVFM